MDLRHVFSADIVEQFQQHLESSRNVRRVSLHEQAAWVSWLTESASPALSQQESSRRHYVKKTFRWDSREQLLCALPKGQHCNARRVITNDRIVDVVREVHEQNGHAGWDATWKDVSRSYYGILRADVIFLLKRCMVCALDSRKRPKGHHVAQPVMAAEYDSFMMLDEVYADPMAEAESGAYDRQTEHAT